MIITHIDDEATNQCIHQLNILKSSEKTKNGFSNQYNSLTKKSWWSDNCLQYQDLWTVDFKKAIMFIKNIAERTFHKRLKYNYIHFIDYEFGGSMDFHSHKHAEDYVYILYLNDCFDGETNFYLKEIVSLTPKKSQIVLFESHIEHSGSFTERKQVLVGGLKIL